MKDGKEIDDKTFYKKLDNTNIPSDDDLEEVRGIYGLCGYSFSTRFSWL